MVASSRPENCFRGPALFGEVGLFEPGRNTKEMDPVDLVDTATWLAVLNASFLAKMCVEDRGIPCLCDLYAALCLPPHLCPSSPLPSHPCPVSFAFSLFYSGLFPRAVILTNPHSRIPCREDLTVCPPFGSPGLWRNLASFAGNLEWGVISVQ